MHLDDYYDPGFHFCEPKQGIIGQSGSLGSILFGDRIFNSPYDVSSFYSYTVITTSTHLHPQIRMLKNVTCQELCKSTVPPDDAEFINDRIREDQAINWLVDGLPAAEMKRDGRTNETFFDMGFNLGNDEDPEFLEHPALHNHYNILLKYVLVPYPGQFHVFDGSL